ncbi:Heparin sulfate O-sulfotransferase [Holothuria leucospilota]|uniref:Heparin sulfate O-sulfotransferase n=1 Tax=Holothuria leucospilota TaxID=206669 RepID=A0A9Q1CC91_HOLLE|nr:Heparin sulfate O-sulfotransferase [Holothuria leucospilota]
MSSQAPKNVFKVGLLRCALNCSITALILSIASIIIASYALSFSNVLPVPVKYVGFFTDTKSANIEKNLIDELEEEPKPFDSRRVRRMQESFLKNFFNFRKTVDDTTVVFLSVPLCGGDIFPGLVEKLPHFRHVAEFTEQYPALPNVSDTWSEMRTFMRDFIDKSPKPLFLYIERGSVPIIEDKNIHYVSLICDPVKRLLENYRVDHLGDDLQYVLPPKQRMRTKPVSFETCFHQKRPECYGQGVQSFIIQHFCDHKTSCLSSNLNKPLNASIQTARKFKAIGTLEQFPLFLKFIEKELPTYFSGISQLFVRDDDFEAFRSKNGPLGEPSQANVTAQTFRTLQQHIWPDYGFYWKVRQMFNVQTLKTVK